MVVYGCCGRVAYERDCELSFFFFWRVGVIFFVFSIEREKVPFFIYLLLVIFRRECLMKI
jgi:hypothetical protein